MRINHDQKSMDMEQRDINYILPAYIRNYLFHSKNEDPAEIVFPMFSSVPHPTKPGVTVPIRWVPELSPEAMEISVDGASVAEATEEEIVAKDEVDEMRKEAKAELGLEPVLEAEHTPAPEDLLRQQQEIVQQLQDEVADLQLEVDTAHDEPVSPARAAFAEVPNPPTAEEWLEQQEAEPETVPPTSPPPAGVPTTREIKGPPSGPILPPGTPLDNMGPRDRGDQMRVAKDLRPEPDVDEDKEVEATIKKPEEV